MKVGILGAGQLGRMLALAGYPLGWTFRLFDPDANACSKEIAEVITGNYDDPSALKNFAEGCDFVTYEFENVPVDAVKEIEKVVPVFPNRKYLEIAQDRVLEKNFFAEHHIPTTDTFAISNEIDIASLPSRCSFPGMLKTRRGGYDGKGQVKVASRSEMSDAWARLKKVSCIYENFIDFTGEVSIIGVRSKSGECRFYDLVENEHREGILRLSQAPSNRFAGLQKDAENYCKKMLEALGYVGILTIEFFVRDNKLIANEIAPRVHNSGHWTLDGSETSQFANHVRAVSGLPLGPTRTLGYAAMLNCIGALPQAHEVLELIPNAKLHYYGKSERPGRKVGHINLTHSDTNELQRGIKLLREKFKL